MTNIINELTSAFDSFLTRVLNGGQWTYIYIGVIVFTILIYILCRTMRRWK